MTLNNPINALTIPKLLNFLHFVSPFCVYAVVLACVRHKTCFIIYNVGQKKLHTKLKAIIL